MAYLQPAGGEPLPHDLIEAMGRSIDLTIPPEDLPELATALRDQLATIDRIEMLDLTGVSPTLQFDPRWHD